MLYLKLTCSMILSVDLAHYQVSRAKGGYLKKIVIQAVLKANTCFKT